MRGVKRSAARSYCLVAGLVLVGAGVLGFFYEATFSTGDGAEREAVLGILDVNGWHNLIHIASGGLALAAAGSYAGSRSYALVFGLAYLLLAVTGFVYGDGGVIAGLVPVNSEDNVLHLLIGLAGLWAGGATAPHPAPTRMPA